MFWQRYGFPVLMSWVATERALGTSSRPLAPARARARFFSRFSYRVCVRISDTGIAIFRTRDCGFFGHGSVSGFRTRLHIILCVRIYILCLGISRAAGKIGVIGQLGERRFLLPGAPVGPLDALGGSDAPCSPSGRASGRHRARQRLRRDEGASRPRSPTLRDCSARRPGHGSAPLMRVRNPWATAADMASWLVRTIS